MSKLDDIFNDTFVQTLELRLDEDIPAVKQQIKDLMLELMSTVTDDAYWYPQLKQKIEEL